MTILGPTHHTPKRGEATTDYTELCTAHVRWQPLRSWQIAQHQQALIKAEVSVTMLYKSWLNNTHRILKDGQQYSISTLVPSEDKRDMVLTVTRVAHK